MIYNIARDFSKFPAGMTYDDGPYNGLALRSVILYMLKTNPIVTIELDGTLGYAASFLQSAFQNLHNVLGVTHEELKDRLKFASKNRACLKEIDNYIMGRNLIV